MKLRWIIGIASALLLAATGADASVLVNKAFAPTSVNLGVTSDVTITLSNTSTGSAANVTSLSDDIATMGGKAVMASPNNIATTCAGGTPSVSGTVVSLAGGVIPMAADSTHPGLCTVSFTVVGAVVGNGVNSIAIGALVTDQGNNATAASQTLQILTSSLTVTGTAPATLLSSATAAQTYTITNPTASAITNATFPVTFTNGATSTPVTQYTLASGSTGACTGTISPSTFTSTNATPSVGTTTVSGLTIPANGSCTITLNVTDPVAATGVIASSTLATGAITDDQGVTNSTLVNDKSQFYSGLASVSKGFSPSIVVANGTSRMTVTIKNTQAIALTNVAFSDVMPTFMTLDANPAPSYSNCGSPTLTGNGTATLGISGATVATSGILGTNGTSCTITVTVDTAAGAYGSLVNNIPAANLTDTQNVAGQALATATLAISAGALNSSKSFATSNPSTSPVSAIRNIPFTETLSFINGGSTPLTGGSFTDNLPQTPAAMQYYPGYTPVLTNCGSSPTPTLTATAGNTVVSSTSANLVIAAATTCTVKFQVILTSGGFPQQTDTNTLSNANVSFTDSGSNVIHPTVNVSATVLTLPAFTVKNFIANAGGVANQPVTVQGQIIYSSNSAGLVTDTNVSATFVLNASGHNVKLAPSPNYQFSGGCAGASASNVTAVSVLGNVESLVLALTTLSSTCTFSYDVVNENTITAPSTVYSPGTSSYTSTENGGTSTTPGSGTVTFYTASLLVNKVFTPNSIASGGTATAKFTLDVASIPQLSSTQANGVTFTDSLPANMAFAIAPNVTLSAGCTQSGQVPPASGTPSGTTITFANISLLAGTDCIATFDATSNFLGNTTNTIAANALQSTSGAVNSQSASASLTVVAGVALQKTFLSSSFAIGDVNYVRFLIINSSSGVLSAGTLTDAMPSALALASLTAQPAAQGGDPVSCGGSVTGTIGSSTFALSGMSVAGATGPSAPGQCVQYVQVKASSTGGPGALVNSIPAGGLSIGGQTNLTGTTTPPETVVAAPNATLTQAFSPASIIQAGVSTLTITVTNTSTLAAALTGLALVDTLPAGVAVAPTPNATTSCGAGTATATAGGTTLTLASGSLAANATCTLTVNVTSAAANTYTNTIAAGALTTTQGATNALTTAVLTVAAAPNVTLTKAFAPAFIAPNGTSVLTLTIANTAGSAAALTSVALTDTFPTGITVAAVPGASTTCPSGTVTATAGAASLALAGGTLAINASCTVTVNVTGTTPGGLTNAIAANALSSAQGASNGTIASATLTVLAITLTKAFVPATIAAAGTSVLTITIPNTATGALALTGVGLTDTLPSGITIAATPNVSLTCSGTVTAAAGSSSITLAGGGVPAGTTCTFSANVTGTLAAAYTNTIPAGALTTAQGITNAAPASAPLAITYNGIVLAKAFAPATIAAGGTSVLTITIPNTAPGAIMLTGVGLTDTLPSGLTIAPTPNASTTCPAGTVTAVAGSASVALAAASLAANATCTVTVSVTGTMAAAYTNTIAANAFVTTQSISNPAPATAGLTIGLAALPVSKAFAPTSIPAGGTSTLTITIPNTAAGNVALTNAALTDTLPSGVTIAPVPSAATTCVGGTATATAGGTTIALAGGTLAAGATCTLSVSVTSSVAAVYANSIAAGALTTTQGASNAPATANLTVTLNAIALTQAFSPTSISAGGISTLTITIPNTAAGAVALTALALSDALPSGIVLAAVPNATTTCAGGAVTATAGSSSVALASGTVAANASCTISVNVTGSVATAYTNTIAASALTSTQGVSNTAPATANLTIVPAATTLSVAFAPASIAAGGTSTLTITIPNTASGAVTLTGMTLSDALPPGVTIAATPNAATTCSGGSVTATAGGSSVALATGTLAVNATCTITVSVTGTAAAVYTNTIAAGALTTAQSVSNAAPASATLTITLNGLTLSKAFAPASIVAGGTSTLTITIPNTASGAVTLTGMALNDALPSGVSIAATPSASTTCSGGSVTATAGGSSVALANGTLAVNATCTITVSVTGTAAGVYTNTIAANALTTAQSVSNAAPASATLTITLNGITLTKAFAPASIPAAGISTLTLTIPNTAIGAPALANVALSDSFPAGVIVAAAPAASSSCGGTLLATPGAANIALSGAAIPATATCTIAVNVTSATLGGHINTIAAAALTDTQGVTNSATATATLSVTGALPVTLSKAFVPASMPLSGTSVLTVTIANTAAMAASLTNVALADPFPAGMTVAAVPNASTTCSAGTVTATSGATSVTLSGASIAANASCTITVNVTSTTSGASTNTIPIGALTSTQGASNATAAAAVLTVASAPVAVSKAFAPPSIFAGGTSVLTVTLANTAAGAGALTLVSLGDTLPAGMRIAAVANAGTTCTSAIVAAAPGAATLALSGASIAAGATCTISASVTSSTLGTSTNTIAAGALTSAQGVTNAVSASAPLTVASVQPVTVSEAYAAATIATGGLSTLTITIANTAPGAVALSAIALTDAMPPGTVVAPTPTASTTCTSGTLTAAANAASLGLSAGSLAANASCTIVVNVTGPAAGAFLNNIPANAVTSAQGATNAVAAQATLTIAAVSLRVTKTSNAAVTGVAPGGTIIYTIVVTNSGTTPETHAALVDTLTNATFVPGSLSVNGAAGVDGVILTATPFGSIAPGATATLVYSALVGAGAAPGGAVTNSATVSGDQPCSGAMCGATAAPVAIVAPAVNVAVTIDGLQSETVLAGQVVTYAMTVTNTGSVTATNVELIDTVPAGATPIPGTLTLGGVPDATVRGTRTTAASSTIDGQVVSVPIGTLAGGANIVITFRATMSSFGNEHVINSASVSANGLPSVVFSNQVVAIMVSGALHITKTAGAAVATVGDRVNYAVTIAPPSGLALGATTITDTLPAYEAYAPGTARIAGASGEPVVSGQVLTWTLTTLSAPVTITYATAILTGAPPQSVLTNIVRGLAANGSGAGPSTGSASASVVITGTTFGSCYPITGRVFSDTHDSGRFDTGDVGIAQVRIYLEDGESVATDAHGRYDFPCVRQGMHAMRLDTSTLPAGVTAFDDRALDSTRSTRRLIHATLDATILQDINFAVRPAPKASP